MSEIRTDTISAANGTDPVTLTKQSAAKAWVDFNSTPTVNNSFNISSITDNGVGDYTFNYSTSMVSGYAVCGGSGNTGSIRALSPRSASGATSVAVYTGETLGSVYDSTFNTASIHGDLA